MNPEQIVDGVIASGALEGWVCDDECRAVLLKVAAGEMSAEAAVQLALNTPLT